jgi:hypothetical protein
VHSFPFSLEGGAIGTTVCNASLSWLGAFVSFCQVIRVHALVDEVDNRVRRVGEAMVHRPLAL